MTRATLTAKMALTAKMRDSSETDVHAKAIHFSSFKNIFSILTRDTLYIFEILRRFSFKK
jgi:hypothetical protein